MDSRRHSYSRTRASATWNRTEVCYGEDREEMTGKMDLHLVRSIFTIALAKPLQCPFKIELNQQAVVTHETRRFTCLVF
jgi:hypothetical protein